MPTIANVLDPFFWVCHYGCMHTIHFDGDRLRAARHRAGVTQEGLARAVGVTTGAIQNAELGRSVPGGDLVARIAISLDVVMESLYTHSSDVGTSATGGDLSPTVTAARAA